jgi:hypothetical protein
MVKVLQEQTENETVLSADRWHSLQREHETVLSEILTPYLEKRSRQEKDPVMDFLFEYYAFRPSHLLRWSPGIGVSLDLEDDDLLPDHSELMNVEKGKAFLDPESFPQKRRSSVRWMLGLLKKSAGKKPLFGCFGMHEWAMVYRAGDVRHNQTPLRLSDEEIAEFVESRPLVCTHFDAYRFFTKPAKPLNKHVLSREGFQDSEQPGCIHTNMDLYKWAFKLYPWIPGELLRMSFLNALEARKIDMQASPYDAREFGLDPIRIETEEGRREYINKQTEIHESSMPIRLELIRWYERVLELTEVVESSKN